MTKASRTNCCDTMTLWGRRLQTACSLEPTAAQSRLVAVRMRVVQTPS